ncbi:FAD-dependent monooxygenase [Saccharopolyspora elongata]|uniref:FAD-dependent oxidoreductase n=1 Tax=Saccharopolyspora elongata TaxID=2530387 RepID=A0A4R4ZAC4_9PSEU|nr:FAD-dependent monooxygenase [Saccharopolyspora elongata]TDD55268.1 FAD-dependent oxidoreductase [Saccharopolyspora elongata]
MKVVICGAGIAGLALAGSLMHTGIEVVVVERARRPREQGYMIDFFGPGYDAAEHLGVLPRLVELGYRVEEAAYLDAAGRRRAGLGYERFARSLGGRLLSIMRPDLERALREHVSDATDLRFGSVVVGVESGSDGVRVALSDGSAVEGDVLVGADGIHSTVRRLVFGEEERYLRYLGFHTVAYTFEDREVSRLVGDRFCLTDTVEQQMGFYGLRDGRVAVFAVHRTDNPNLPDDPQAEVQRKYASLGWIAPRALAQCPPASELYYDQVAQIQIDRWSAGRVVLLGDACQAVSLLAGQGASLAVGGAVVLGRQLAAEPIGTALERYQELWRPVVAEKQQVGRRLVPWFLPKSRLRLAMRRMMMRMTGLPGADRFFGSALAGKSGLPL